ncbi:HAMP domain-containing histidine kinase [Kitasatospora purpeofusca]|uniref:HAMP domain-containing sensor histidine kinase n=1 Tax=Kitasatospora purpeofusca TaxID=67352 RepID=UPI002250DC38|nr:HAMP domain-containing sensor histidine kinase [Kitasatospora purpeofusca]MCX4683159.1 HAMP domain-containing histidine kinase [Kitasatospora purpeofusca]
MLRTRITLVVVAATLLAVVVSVVSSYRGVTGMVADQFDRALVDRADAVAAVLDAGRVPAERPDTAEQLLLPDGTVRPLSPGRAALPVPPGALDVARSGEGRLTAETTVGDRTFGVLVQGRGEGHGALVVSQDYAEAERMDQEFLGRISWTTAGSAAACAALSWLLIGRILRPMRRLARAAERISSTQDLGTALPAAGRDEVGRLTLAFEVMLDALRRSREAQQRLVQNASHELRTPLTSVRGSAELLQRARGRLAPEDEEKILGTLVSESVALDGLVRELVELATDRQADEDPVPLDLAAAAEDCADRFRRRTGRVISVVTVTTGAAGTAGAGPDRDGAVVVLARPRALHRCIDNLLANAVKFSPGDTPVAVLVETAVVGTAVVGTASPGPERGGTGGRGRARPGVPSVRLVVRDHGPGIGPEERDAVFDRFYRGAGTQSTPGSGLGLAIVHDLVTADRGTVFAGTGPGGGAEVGFTLPRAVPAPRRG